MARPDWTPCPDGKHLWERIERWMGRYRCQRCGIIGWNTKALSEWDHRGITPYVCPKCHGPTTSVKKKKPQPCPQCRSAPNLLEGLPTLPKTQKSVVEHMGEGWRLGFDVREKRYKLWKEGESDIPVRKDTVEILKRKRVVRVVSNNPPVLVQGLILTTLGKKYAAHISRTACKD